MAYSEYPDASYEVTIPASQWFKNNQKFDPSLINTDTDLNTIIQRISFVGEPEGLTFCFYGASGTGKTEYARYISQQLQKPSMCVHTADIQFSKYGMTERVLERLFQKATRERAVLIFDEADAFLFPRQSTDRPYEASIICEFLRLFETHSQPIICTTNFLDSIDPAFLRRFMFKIEFNPLTKEQMKTGFQHYFDLPMPNYIEKLPMLTLGDFGLVHKKAKVLGYLYDSEALCKLFYEESKARYDQKEARKKRRLQ